MTAKAPVEKLPLAARKNIRDELEANRADLESQLSKLLGNEEWKIDVNSNLIYAYAEPESYGNHSPGSCIKAYIDGAIYQLKYFLESQGHGDEGVAAINKATNKHVITLYPDLAKKNSYCGVDITEGVLRILFAEKSLGSNVNYALEKLEEAINQAVEASESAESLSYTARNGIKQDYTKDIDEVLAKIRKQLHNDDFKLNPNFEAVAAGLKGKKDARDDWERNLASFTKQYFESLEKYLKYNKFEEDDMMYEAFNEAVSKNEAVFRVVNTLSPNAMNNYHEILIEDGVLVLQTTPSKSGSNVDYIADKIVDIL